MRIAPQFPFPVLRRFIASPVRYEEAQLGPKDIEFFGLYDCFPICLIRALESVGLAGRGQGGAWIEDKYRVVMKGAPTSTGRCRPSELPQTQTTIRRRCR